MALLRWTFFILTAVTTLASTLVHAQVFKCVMADGSTSYSQTPCSSGVRRNTELDVFPQPTLPAQTGDSSQQSPTSSARSRPVAPLGVDDPLADPQRPRLCAERQNEIDAGVADVKRLLLEQEAQALEFEALEKKINAFMAASDGKRHSLINLNNRYAVRDKQKTEMTSRVGGARMRLESSVQDAYRLNCQVLGIKMRLKDAEGLRPAR